MNNDLFRRVHVPLIVVYLLFGVIGLMAVGILTYSISDHAAHSAASAAERRLETQNKKAQSSTVDGCNRNQLLRGYVLLRARELQPTPAARLAPRYFPITDCYATYVTNSGGEAVYLSPPLQECFLKLMESKAFGPKGEDVTTNPSRLHVEYNCT